MNYAQILVGISLAGAGVLLFDISTYAGMLLVAAGVFSIFFGDDVQKTLNKNKKGKK